MSNYLVEWSIDVEANSPEDAAQKALDIQRRVGSSAVVFWCIDESGEKHEIDLDNA